MCPKYVMSLFQLYKLALVLQRVWPILYTLDDPDEYIVKVIKVLFFSFLYPIFKRLNDPNE